MAFNRFRPTSHFIAPHSWMNDPCGAVWIQETQEYRVCYQWSPGSSKGGNSAWGMAKSKDLITWHDCTPALSNGTSYDSLGVFSGSIVSRIVDGQRFLYLFYTSVSSLPIHWSLPYVDGCESQSVAFSTDFGKTWHRYQHNPLLLSPPDGKRTTGWRDPFVSQSQSLSKLLGGDVNTNFMMIASGDRDFGSQLCLYQSNDLLVWEFLGTVLKVKHGSNISPTSGLQFGKNFECVSFFSLGRQDYIIVGVEEDTHSKRHNGHYLLWLSGKFTPKNGSLDFEIQSHGLLDHGITYAAHIFRDSDNRLIQLGWADESAKESVIVSQGWAGCLAHPRELFEMSKPISDAGRANSRWFVDEESGTMSTLGICPAPQVTTLRSGYPSKSLRELNSIRSKTFELTATFRNLSGNEEFVFNVRQSPDQAESTMLIFDLVKGVATVDRSKSSVHGLGTSTPDFGDLNLLDGEDLVVRIFVDVSLIEIYVNDRFALTSRIYPSLESSICASYDLGSYPESAVDAQLWDELSDAWPDRSPGYMLTEMGAHVGDEPKLEVGKSERVLYPTIVA
ncbi:hypothetical protein N7508_005762 [Penicillium antarcticum]|uniref:uncharacterized protein n=1 Tax=Penicillium antarcticum TaxID=416450 RepID=UPI00239FEB6C|nr:uncharacterized protein N7508_005762 [Penicillium antarcticum]KAJ5306747.1 hypothetical protein N7508_005762 [Penicillium antarcticum]